MSKSFIWPLDRIPSNDTTLSQSGPGSDGNKGVLRIPQSSRIADASLSDCLVSYPGHLLRESYPYAETLSVYSSATADCVTRWESLFPLQRCSQCILQPHPTPQKPTEPLVGKVLLLYRDTVSVFYSPGRLGTSLKKSYPSAEMQSVYSIAPTNQPTGPLVGEVLSFCRDAVSVFYGPHQPADWATRWVSLIPLQRCSQCTGPLVGEVLLFCRDTVGVFYGPHQPADWATRWGSLIPLQRCSQCILWPPPTSRLGHSLGKSYSSAEIQSVYSTPHPPKADWSHSLGKSYSSCQRYSRCIL